MVAGEVIYLFVFFFFPEDWNGRGFESLGWKLIQDTLFCNIKWAVAVLTPDMNRKSKRKAEARILATTW